MAVKLLIIDDENKTRNLLSNLLESLQLNIEISTAGEDVKSGIKAVQNFSPDIVLLDVQMPDGTGFDFLDLIPDRNFAVIFVTAHQEYAIQAIKAKAMDYILKPVDIDELSQALSNAAKSKGLTLTPKVVEKNGETKVNNGKVILRTHDSIFMVQLNELVRCEADGNYTTFYLENGKKITTSKTLKEYKDILNQKGFYKCHRSHIINLSFFDRFEKNNGGFIILRGNHEVPLARSCKEEFFQLLEEF
jgi:two-component system LytT family response regulator